MAELSIQQLRMLSDHDIDYASLSDDILAQLATGDEMFVATSALAELSTRRSDRTAPVAREILSEDFADHHLRSAALEAEFDADRPSALDYIQRTAAQADLTLLRTMAEIIFENPQVFVTEPALTSARAVAKRLRQLGESGDATSAAARAEVLARYS